MAKFDVHEILSARYLANGWIDFVVRGELDDLGTVVDVPYTWNPNEVFFDAPWPMATNIYAKFLDAPFDPEPYVWTPPEKTDLEYRLRQELKRAQFAHYKELLDVTGEPIPAEVLAARDKALATYTAFRDALPKVPQDWADDHHWRAET